jgi:DNA-binding response OmpR family regulator
MPASQKATVLIIEDDHDSRVELRNVLEGEGFLIYTAADGQAGIDLLARISPCVIVLDQNLPIMSGDDFLKIKMQNKKFASIPVIVISAVENRVTRLGANEYFRKPFDLNRLIAAIRKHCKRNGSCKKTAETGTT